MTDVWCGDTRVSTIYIYYVCGYKLHTQQSATQFTIAEYNFSSLLSTGAAPSASPTGLYACVPKGAPRYVVFQHVIVSHTNVIDSI